MFIKKSILFVQAPACVYNCLVQSSAILAKQMTVATAQIHVHQYTVLTHELHSESLLATGLCHEILNMYQFPKLQQAPMSTGAPWSAKPLSWCNCIYIHTHIYVHILHGYVRIHTHTYTYTSIIKKIYIVVISINLINTHLLRPSHVPDGLPQAGEAKSWDRREPHEWPLHHRHQVNLLHGLARQGTSQALSLITITWQSAEN